MVSKLRSINAAIQFNLKVQSLPDRRYLREQMLPAIADQQPSHVLLAGTRRYTQGYPKFFDSRVTAAWTIDFDESAARFGNGPLHRTGDMRHVDEVFRGIRFDVIHVNGILGFGVDSPDDIQSMLLACHKSLQPNGYVMLGWDADRTADPLNNETVSAHFRHCAFAELPARHRVVGIEGHDHIFDWFKRS